MSDALCPECRVELVASARAALSVLADNHSTQTDRTVAAGVLIDRAQLLRLPSTDQLHGDARP